MHFFEKTAIHNPENEYPITEIFAFLSEDAEGRNGILGGYLNGNWIALVTAKTSLLEKMKPIAQELAGQFTGKKIKLVKFTNKVEVETL